MNAINIDLVFHGNLVFIIIKITINHKKNLSSRKAHLYIFVIIFVCIEFIFSIFNSPGKPFKTIIM